MIATLDAVRLPAIACRMVKFSFNALGYVFQEGVSSILRSYAEANTALVESRDRAIEELMGYECGLVEGKPWIGERDEDGNVLWDESAILSMKIAEAEHAVGMARKAFTLILYHHWESGARQWTNKPNGGHAKLAPAVEALGLTLHPDLFVLYKLTNALKHNNDKCGNELLQVDATLLPLTASYPTTSSNWFEAIGVSDHAVTRFINAVGCSGPTSDTIFKTPHQ